MKFKRGDKVVWADWVIEESNGSTGPEIPRIGTVTRRGSLSPKEYADRYFEPPPFDVERVFKIRRKEKRTVCHSQRVFVKMVWKSTGETCVDGYSGKWFKKIETPRRKK